MPARVHGLSLQCILCLFWSLIFILSTICLPGELEENFTTVSTTRKDEKNFTTISAAHKDGGETSEDEEHPWWYKDSLNDIAYYLRAHKFNEYDRRYNRNGTNVERTYFRQFPKPPLRTLHWEVHRYCEPSFKECVDYLRKKLKHVAIKRQDDTSVVALDSNMASSPNVTSNKTEMIEQIDLECKKMLKIDEDIAPPFEGPLERYQWRSTASYYMCWYTTNEVPDLRHLGEKCDNFAHCLDPSFGPNNRDERASDSEPFACALYSFCPDPCCPNKYLPKKEHCWREEKNPCFHENAEGQRECTFRREENRDFTDIVLNRWNVSCECSKKGYVWSSLYGTCIDIDECADSNLNNCKLEGQACLNLPGTFSCVCKWGYFYDEKQNVCTISGAISKIKLNNKPVEEQEAATDKWKAFMRAVLKIIGAPLLPTST